MRLTLIRSLSPLSTLPRLILFLGLLCFISLSAYAQTPLNPSASATKSDQPTGDIELQHAESQKLWDELHQELLDLCKLHAQHEDLPEPSIFKPFSNNKKRNQKKNQIVGMASRISTFT